MAGTAASAVAASVAARVGGEMVAFDRAQFSYGYGMKIPSAKQLPFPEGEAPPAADAPPDAGATSPLPEARVVLNSTPDLLYSLYDCEYLDEIERAKVRQVFADRDAAAPPHASSGAESGSPEAADDDDQWEDIDDDQPDCGGSAPLNALGLRPEPQPPSTRPTPQQTHRPRLRGGHHQENSVSYWKPRPPPVPKPHDYRIPTSYAHQPADDDSAAAMHQRLEETEQQAAAALGATPDVGDPAGGESADPERLPTPKLHTASSPRPVVHLQLSTVSRASMVQHSNPSSRPASASSAAGSRAPRRMQTARDLLSTLEESGPAEPSRRRPDLSMLEEQWGIDLASFPWDFDQEDVNFLMTQEAELPTLANTTIFPPVELKPVKELPPQLVERLIRTKQTHFLPAGAAKSPSAKSPSAKPPVEAAILDDAAATGSSLPSISEGKTQDVQPAPKTTPRRKTSVRVPAHKMRRMASYGSHWYLKPKQWSKHATIDSGVQRKRRRRPRRTQGSRDRTAASADADPHADADEVDDATKARRERLGRLYSTKAYLKFIDRHSYRVPENLRGIVVRNDGPKPTPRLAITSSPGALSVVESARRGSTVRRPSFLPILRQSRRGSTWSRQSRSTTMSVPGIDAV